MFGIYFNLTECQIKWFQNTVVDHIPVTDVLVRCQIKWFQCVDWSRIEKKDYLQAMQESPVDARHIFRLIEGALTTKIDDRGILMKGIDYSYYYEEAGE